MVVAAIATSVWNEQIEFVRYLQLSRSVGLQSICVALSLDSEVTFSSTICV